MTIELEHYNLRRGARARRRDFSEALFDLYGINEAEYRIIVAAMAHYRCFGVAPQRMDLESIGTKTDAVHLAVRARFLEETPLKALRPTKKAWKEFGVASAMNEIAAPAAYEEALGADCGFR